MSFLAKLAISLMFIFIASGQFRVILPELARLASDAQGKQLQYGKFSRMLTGKGTP